MAIVDDSAVPNRSSVFVTFDPKADAAYVRFANLEPGDAVTQVIVEGIPSPTDIVLDFGIDGQLLGVEIIGARAVLSPELLASASPPSPPLRHNSDVGEESD